MEPAYDASISQTITVQASAYSAGNVMGGLQTIGPVLRSGVVPVPSAVLDNLMLISAGGSTIGVTVYLFDQNPTASTFTDKTALTLAAADLPKLAYAPVTLTPAVPQGATAAVAQLPIAVSIENHDSPATRNFYAAVVANASVTPAGTLDLILKFGMALN